MKDQHTKITGYRDLSQQEIDLMNEIKQAGYSFIPLMQKIKDTTLDSRQARDLAIAKTHLEQAVIFMVRVVANPDDPLRDFRL